MNKKSDNLKSLAKWDLERHKDYYAAEAMDDKSCTHNHLIGNCGIKCPVYLLGKCPIEEEIFESEDEKE